MSVLLLGLLVSLASAHGSSGITCPGNETCWQYELGEIVETVSEDRVLASLLCHLDCLDTGEKGEKLALCQGDCSTEPQNDPEITLTLSAPVSRPFLEEWNQDGLYVITIPNVTDSNNSMMSSGSDAALIGSGDTGSDGDLATGSEIGYEVYLVRVSWHGNDTYFPLTSNQEVLNLTQFSCSEVDISYAVLSTGGSLSPYSPPLSTCVFIPQADVPAARNLNVQFEEIAGAPRYLQQARLIISWDAPSDVSRLAGYLLNISHVPTEGEFADQAQKICPNQPTFIFDIDQEQTNFTIEPNGNNFTSILFACTYNIELVSLPGDGSVSLEQPILYDREDRRDFVPECGGTYIPSSVSYNLSISWRITDQLVLETITGYSISIVPIHHTLNFHRYSQTNYLTFEKGQTNFSDHFVIPVLTNSLPFKMEVKPLRPGRKASLFWRRSLVPSPEDCEFTAIAFSPETISEDDVKFQMKSISSGVLNFSITWAPPTFLNGDLERYEICVGEEGVAGAESCSQPSDCFYVHSKESDSANNLVGCTPLGVVGSSQQHRVDIGYHVVSGTELLFLQIRAVNSFMLLGEWGEPLLIFNATEFPGIPGSTGSPTSMVWVYIVSSMLGVVVLALVAVMVMCVYRHFCFHRRIKYEDTMVLERIRGDYLPPSFFPVADDWEIPTEDVEIFDSEELGHGAFGRVYRGLLHSHELRDLVTRGRWSFRKRGSFGRRRSSSSRLKASQGVGSCLVAIKRLRDNIDGPDKANFLREIEMMKKVSGTHHDHQMFVVNMLACVTVQEPMMLVLEYAINGDLLTYLRNSREEDETSAANSKAAPYLEPMGAYSKLPPREPGQEEEEEEEHKLTEKDLLSFARQIAAGMEFLAGLNVVHRDLACRNILVCGNSLVKISDFGLSRSLVNQEAYVTTTKGVLPIRWMAPEALFYRTFDTQSDVWSLGILLWELYTLGGYPYPTMSNRDIIELLSAGYRMDKPELCSDQVYNVMLQCWNNLGVERPTFEELYLTFDNILSESTRHQSPYIQVLGNCYYDKLGPRVQVDSDTLDLENVPANVDLRQPTNAATSTEGVFGTSLPETGNGFLSVGGGASNRTPSQDHGATPTAGGGCGLGVPLHLSRPRSWVGTSTAELGPRYVPAPLFYGSPPSSSTSNLTQETVFGNSVVTLSPERHRQLSALQSRSVGSLPLLTNNNNNDNNNLSSNNNDNNAGTRL